MFIFYCDESGSPLKHGPGLVNAEEDRWYTLGGLAVPENKRNNLFSIVQRLRQKYIQCLAPHGLLYENSIEAEIKGSRLFARVESRKVDLKLWEQLKEKDAEALVTGLLGDLEKSGMEGHFYVVSVDQRLLYRKMYRIAHNAPFIALTFLQQRACNLLDGKGELGLFVVDRGSAVEHELDVSNFLAARDRITTSLPFKPRYDLCLIEDPVCATSRDVAQLQVCDVLLYIVARAVREGNPSWDWFQRAKPFLASHFSTGKKLNAGLTFYPEESIPPNFASV